MSIRHLSVDTSAGEVEDVLHDMTDGTFVVVAVEIFDAPTSKVGEIGELKGETIGPWVLGPEAEVYAWLEEHGHEDFADQYSEGLACTPCPVCGQPTYEDWHSETEPCEPTDRQ